MTHNQPLESFFDSELVFEAEDRLPTLFPSQFPSRIAVYDNARLCDNNGLLEGQIAER
jgi:hypothetical protein